MAPLTIDLSIRLLRSMLHIHFLHASQTGCSHAFIGDCVSTNKRPRRSPPVTAELYIEEACCDVLAFRLTKAGRFLPLWSCKKSSWRPMSMGGCHVTFRQLMRQLCHRIHLHPHHKRNLPAEAETCSQSWALVPFDPSEMGPARALLGFAAGSRRRSP